VLLALRELIGERWGEAGEREGGRYLQQSRAGKEEKREREIA
jgi:hypothetical protein